MTAVRDTVDEAVDMVLRGPWDSRGWRRHVEERYHIDRMMEGLDAACGF